jgi:lysyl-tRNA synthetase class 2
MPPGQTVRLAGRWLSEGASQQQGILVDETGRVAARLETASEGMALQIDDLVAVGGAWTGEAVDVVEAVVLHRPSGPPPWELRGVHPPDRLRAAAEARKLLYTVVRSFFDAREFLEVETPLLLATPALQRHIEELTTTFRRPDGSARKLYLSTSPEHAMKRLLAAGLERLYQIAPFFRDGELSDLHAPAFAGLEWYEAHTDYSHCMRTTEALVVSVAYAVAGSLSITYRGEKVDLTPPWERLTVAEAFARELAVELDPACPAEDLREPLRQGGVDVGPDDDWETCFFKAYIQKVEPALGRGKPTLLLDWPIQMAAMARPKPEDPRWCERFELYVAGLELGNAFSELTDSSEQRSRFEEVAAGRPGQKPDELLLEALDYGVPPASGMAMGLDRLLMLLTDAPTIADVLLFPPHHEWDDLGEGE